MSAASTQVTWVITGISAARPIAAGHEPAPRPPSAAGTKPTRSMFAASDNTLERCLGLIGCWDDVCSLIRKRARYAAVSTRRSSRRAGNSGGPHGAASQRPGARYADEGEEKQRNQGALHIEKQACAEPRGRGDDIADAASADVPDVGIGRRQHCQCNGSQSVTVVQNDRPASVSGVNRKMISGTRIAGRLPNRMRSSRKRRTPAAARPRWSRWRRAASRTATGG